MPSKLPLNPYLFWLLMKEKKCVYRVLACSPFLSLGVHHFFAGGVPVEKKYTDWFSTQHIKSVQYIHACQPHDKMQALTLPAKTLTAKQHCLDDRKHGNTEQNKQANHTILEGSS